MIESDIELVVQLRASATDLRAAAAHSPRPYRKPYKRIANQLDVASSGLLQLATIRAEYARYLTHRDTYELARAIGQVISEPVDVLPEDQRAVVRHPDDETSSDA